MIGSSRASIAVVREAVNAEFGNPELAQTGRELLQVADLLGKEQQLTSALSDSGRPAEARKTVIQTLLGSQLNAVSIETAGLIASQRWSSSADLVDAFELAGAQALFGAAEKEGSLDVVEDELFRFGRIVSADGELQLALSSPSLSPDSKRGILSDLLDSKASPTTTELLGFVTTHLRGRRIESAIESLSTLAAERQGKLVAVVRSARPLEEEQATKLASVLERIYKQPVLMQAEVDPALLGGISVQIGDEVIDGSIAGRLEAAKRRITG